MHIPSACALFLVFVASGLPAQSVSDVLAGPVKMMGYASGVAIEWRAADESAVDYYVVRRITPAGVQTVATLEPRGFDDSLATYRYIDQSDFELGLAFQLRVALLDGGYAETEPLAAESAHGRRTRILSALDETSLARLHINLDSERDQHVVLRIKTLGGETLNTYHKELTAGANQLEIDYEGWPAGYYSVELSDTTQQLQWLVHVDPAVPVARTRRVQPRS